MENVRHLRSGIIGVRRLCPVGERHGRAARERVIGERRRFLTGTRRQFTGREDPIVQPHLIDQALRVPVIRVARPSDSHSPCRLRDECPRGRAFEHTIEVELPGAIAVRHRGVNPLPRLDDRRRRDRQIPIAPTDDMPRGIDIEAPVPDAACGRLDHDRLELAAGLRLDPGRERERPRGSEIEIRGKRDRHMIIHAIEAEGLADASRREGDAVLQDARVPVLTVRRSPLRPPPADQAGSRGGGTGGGIRRGHATQPIQHIIGVAGLPGRMSERQSIAGLVVVIVQCDIRLIGRAIGFHRGESIRQIIRHREHAIRVRDVRQVSNLVVLITGEQIPGERLAQQLVHRIIGQDNLVQLGCDPLGQIIIAVILVGFDFV